MTCIRHGLLPLLSSPSLSLSYTVQLPPHPTHKFALISHPLARLGGSSRDHVVRSLAAALGEAGWGVVTYDSRGAGRSGGSCSFSGTAEAEDYSTILHQIVLPLFPPPSPSTPSRPHLLLAGYSAGSLSASLCPPLPDVRTDYLFISYPLSVLWALTLFHSSTFTSGLKSLVEGKVEEEEGEGRRIMSVWGDGDQFTGVEKYRNWSKSIEGADKAWRAVEVSGADHFWGGEGKREEMIGEVLRWLDSE